MFNLERLAMAMIEHEGWIPPSGANFKEGSRSFRNHNPGNLRSSPFQFTTKDGFAVFKTDIEGWNAMIWDLKQKATGNTSTGLNGESTLFDLIHVWAPAEDNNNPVSYLNHICGMTGFSKDMKLKELLK
jgi:hypothetical protein